VFYKLNFTFLVPISHFGSLLLLTSYSLTIVFVSINHPHLQGHKQIAQSHGHHQAFKMVLQAVGSNPSHIISSESLQTTHNSINSSSKPSTRTLLASSPPQRASRQHTSALTAPPSHRHTSLSHRLLRAIKSTKSKASTSLL
jgi:hypothetical protein